MSIEERRSEVIEFHKKGAAGVAIITAAPGEVDISLHRLKTLAQLEEYVVALRRAAKAANLPDGPGEAKSA